MTKLCIFIFSFLFFLLLLELSLRVIGYFYYNSRIQSDITNYPVEESTAKEEILPKFGHLNREDSEEIQKYKLILNKKHSEVGKDTYTILCTGDSYTFGGMVSYEETFPYQLQEKLNRKSYTHKFKVINAGVCEYNSHQLLKRLPCFIKRYNPDTIILLVGSCNKFNFALYDFGQRSIMGFIRSLRIYKMYKIIRLSLEKRIHKFIINRDINLHFKTVKDNEFGEDGYAIVQPRSAEAEEYFKKMGIINSFSDKSLPYEQVWYYYNRGDTHKAIEVCLEALEKDINSVNPVRNRHHQQLKENDVKPSSSLLDLPITKVEGIPDGVKILCTLAHIYHEKKQFKKASILYDKTYQDYPNSEFVLLHLAYFYGKLCQTEANNNNIENFIKALKFDPFYNLHAYMNLAHNFSRQSKYEAEYIVKKFREMLEMYPGIEKNPLVDNYTVFKKLITKYGGDKYFTDDQHCTVEGHRVIVDNIYITLFPGDEILIKK